MRAVGNVVTGGTGGEAVGLPMQEREDREAVRARMAAKRARQAAASPFAAKPAPPPDAPQSLEGLQRVPVIALVDDPDNPRMDLGDIESLAVSIRESGLIQPIIVRTTPEGDLMIVAGHRRAAAVRRLGWANVDVVIRKAMAPDQVLAAMLVENGQRAGLDPIEEARALARLKASADCSDAVLARKVGLSQPKVSGRLALLALSLAEQEEVRAGHMRLTEATYKARLTSGKIRPKGTRRTWHLGPEHELAHLAKARCTRLKHPRSATQGGVACGACWESVIRADERSDAHARSAKAGACTTCGAAFEPGQATS